MSLSGGLVPLGGGPGPGGGLGEGVAAASPGRSAPLMSLSSFNASPAGGSLADDFDLEFETLLDASNTKSASKSGSSKKKSSSSKKGKANKKRDDPSFEDMDQMPIATAGITFPTSNFEMPTLDDIDGSFDFFSEHASRIRHSTLEENHVVPEKTQPRLNIEPSPGDGKIPEVKVAAGDNKTPSTYRESPSDAWRKQQQIDDFDDEILNELLPAEAPKQTNDRLTLSESPNQTAEAVAKDLKSVPNSQFKFAQPTQQPSSPSFEAFTPPAISTDTGNTDVDFVPSFLGSSRPRVRRDLGTESSFRKVRGGRRAAVTTPKDDDNDSDIQSPYKAHLSRLDSNVSVYTVVSASNIDDHTVNLNVHSPLPTTSAASPVDSLFLTSVQSPQHTTYKPPAIETSPSAGAVANSIDVTSRVPQENAHKPTQLTQKTSISPREQKVTFQIPAQLPNDSSSYTPLPSRLDDTTTPQPQPDVALSSGQYSGTNALNIAAAREISSNTPTTSTSPCVERASIRAQDPSTYPDNKDAIIADLRRQLLQVSHEKEIMEAQLKAENEQLRQRLSALTFSGDTTDTVRDSSAAIYVEKELLLQRNKELVQSCDKLQRDLDTQHQRREYEIVNLKMELEEQAQQLKSSHEREMAMFGEQHREALEALKRLHEQELLAVKKRSQDAKLIDGLAAQVKASCGTLKLLEAQVSSSYRGLDLVKEGQLEARERLLKEMESSAQDMRMKAEEEGYKLTGYIVNLDNLLKSLRSQHTEERERLRAEHMRLEDLQNAMKAQGEHLRRQVEDERALLASKESQFEDFRRMTMVELDAKRRDLEKASSKVEQQQEELRQYVADANRSLEEQSKQQAMEFQRLEKLKSTLEQEVALFEHNKTVSLVQMAQADDLRRELSRREEQLQSEKEKLSTLAVQLHQLSSDVAQRSALADQQLQQASRMQAQAQEALQQTQHTTSQLAIKEQTLHASARRVEADRMALIEERTQVLKSRGHNAHTHTHNTPPLAPYTQTQKRSNPQTSSAHGFGFPMAVTMASSSPYANTFPPTWGTHTEPTHANYPAHGGNQTPWANAPTPAQNRAADAEMHVANQLKDAARFLKSVKGEMNKVHDERISTRAALEQQHHFLHKIRASPGP